MTGLSVRLFNAFILPYDKEKYEIAQKMGLVSKNDLKDDDTKITNRLKRNNITIKSVHIGHKFCFIFHDEINPTNNNTIKTALSRKGRVQRAWRPDLLFGFPDGRFLF